jgi:hypothetical protein
MTPQDKITHIVINSEKALRELSIKLIDSYLELV